MSIQTISAFQYEIRTATKWTTLSQWVVTFLSDPRFGHPIILTCTIVTIPILSRVFIIGLLIIFLIFCLSNSSLSLIGPHSFHFSSSSYFHPFPILNFVASSKKNSSSLSSWNLKQEIIPFPFFVDFFFILMLLVIITILVLDQVVILVPRDPCSPKSHTKTLLVWKSRDLQRCGDQPLSLC